VGLTLGMIKFQHTIFGLPFALLGAVLAAGGWPTGLQVFWILAACVFARSAAMSFNRLHDEPFDRENPRTKTWALPAGLLSRRFVWAFCLACIVGFVFSAAMLNRLALLLSPIALAILLGYSLTKRFTSGAHFFLGLALGIAPIGAWVAVRGELDWPPVLLGFAVLLWSAGFDMIYSLQDIEVDRGLGLNSLPVRLGPRRALAVSALSHAMAIAAFGLLVPFTALGSFYLIALALCAWLLVYEQRLVAPGDLSRLPMAFFAMNGWVSVLMFAGGLADILRTS
jgi:4-hydroxybenzoate polyprenyltransferase